MKLPLLYSCGIDLRVTLCSELLNILAASTGFMVHAACGVNHIDDTVTSPSYSYKISGSKEKIEEVGRAAKLK